jgi:uncharacterized tellurite resistance protein B-like protein
MSILRNLLGLSGTSDAGSDDHSGDTETVRRIVDELEALDSATARYLAAFAYILGRVAHADLDISADETRKMEEIVHGLGHLPEEQAILVVQIAKSQNRLFGGTENFLVTREFKEIASDEQRDELLDCLFAVSAADESISVAEEEEVRRIATELGFEHHDYIAARKKYSGYRDVIKGLNRSE